MCVYSLLVSLSARLQPKWGFLPSSKHVSKDIKSKVCRFCMYQLYKVNTPGLAAPVRTTTVTVLFGLQVTFFGEIYFSKSEPEIRVNIQALLAFMTKLMKLVLLQPERQHDWTEVRNGAETRGIVGCEVGWLSVYSLEYGGKLHEIECETGWCGTRTRSVHLDLL